MREKLFNWLGHEFVALSCEGDAAGDVTAETARIFQRFDERLNAQGLGLANTVRTRLWARDMDCWADGVKERARVLSGDARSVSSSHIRPGRFASAGRIAVDLLAMRPNSDQAKRCCEYEPPGIVLRYLDWENVVFLSGVTVILPSFDEQLPVIVGRITDSLAHAGLAWTDVARASFFLHNSRTMAELRRGFAALVSVPMSVQIPQTDYSSVDTRQGKLVEIEITAERK
jgi:enamine deaminase RidA (YjgF/YER057c/UK114 family)